MPPLTDFLTGNTSLICLQHIFNSMIVFLVYIVFLNGMLLVTMCSTWLILVLHSFLLQGMQIWFQNMFKTYVLQIYWISFCVLIIIQRQCTQTENECILWKYLLMRQCVTCWREVRPVLHQTWCCPELVYASASMRHGRWWQEWRHPSGVPLLQDCSKIPAN